MDKTSSKDFADLAADVVCALTLNPDKVDVSTTQEGDELVLSLSAPRSEIAMVVGRQGETARALHRVLTCIARNWGHEGKVRLAWAPTGD